MSFQPFINRHIGPNQSETEKMLESMGYKTLDELIEKTIPSSIRLKKPIKIHGPSSEYEYLQTISEISRKNKLYKTYIGRGYYPSITPSPILRNIFENPSWYTSYTPYQAEISQGRLEALLNFQTLIVNLTGMEIANASLLDESTAAAEAMIMLYNSQSEKGKNLFMIDSDTFEQTIEVIKTRAFALGIEVVVEKFKDYQFTGREFGALVQYPTASGEIHDFYSFSEQVHSHGAALAVVADIMALVLLNPPGKWGADVVIGSTQRFGIPIGYGGPQAGYFATLEKYKRNIPGRIIGITKDRLGNSAYRMALQTREQHIKREKATSNICTAQALLATMAGMYAVYHGPEGLRNIAKHIHSATSIFVKRLIDLGYKIENSNFFDTVTIILPADVSVDDIRLIAIEECINMYYYKSNKVAVSFGERVTIDDLNQLIEVFAKGVVKRYRTVTLLDDHECLKPSYLRHDEILPYPVFQTYHSESSFMRYVKKLENRDISLTHSMIPLGSCTMKLNAATELIPLSWSEFADVHPFVPLDQAEGYQQVLYELGEELKELTGLHGISFQPNSGAAGEYAGLIVIKQYFIHKKQEHRNVVLIPSSAHGTNPASAAMAGCKIVVVGCDEKGMVSMNDLSSKAEAHKDNLMAFMLTYPSTYGIFEPTVKEMVDIIHKNGGLVYMDGANMNAQIGLTNPGILGVDVCHLNLHKTFAIPHGGGGPGSGPICVADHLIEFLPSHPMVPVGGQKGVSAISASPWGSALICIISLGFIRMLGSEGIKASAQMAILNANYIASQLKNYYGIVFVNDNGASAHELIVDCRPFKTLAGITEIDIAKRLMDYGFHAPTVSFPVAGTLMIEPTESEPKAELDRFIESMINIYREIKEIAEGVADKTDNVLKNAPHTAGELVSENWQHSYSREKACFPLPWIRENKFFPFVSRTDDATGDRNLICTCSSVIELSDI